MFLFLEICAASKSSLVHDLKKKKKKQPFAVEDFFCVLCGKVHCVFVREDEIS